MSLTRNGSCSVAVMRSAAARASGSVGVLQQDAELVAAEPGDRVRGSHDAAEPFSDLREEHVAVLMTERVVHVFEAVQVEQHDRDLPAGTFQPPKRVPDAVIEQGSVRQPGEMIMQRLMAVEFALKFQPTAGAAHDRTGDRRPTSGSTRTREPSARGPVGSRSEHRSRRQRRDSVGGSQRHRAGLSTRCTSARSRRRRATWTMSGPSPPTNPRPPHTRRAASGPRPPPRGPPCRLSPRPPSTRTERRIRPAQRRHETPRRVQLRRRSTAVCSASRADSAS